METREIIVKLCTINEGMHESYMDLNGQHHWVRELSRFIRELQDLPPNKEIADVCSCNGDRRFRLINSVWVCKKCGRPEVEQR